MKEYPLSFKAPLINAIIDGRKIQTRRIIKGVSPEDFPYVGSFDEDGSIVFSDAPGDAVLNRIQAKIPYGLPGDRIWVRETFRPEEINCTRLNHFRAEITYLADKQSREVKAHMEHWRLWLESGKNKPSIHMPRWAARIILEITQVRVERLQSISEEDAKLEGVESPETEREEHDYNICPACGGTRLYMGGSEAGAVFDCDCLKCDTNKKRFMHLWNSLADEETNWNANPWVWVIEFKKLNP